MLLDPFIDYEDEVLKLAKWSLKRQKIKTDNLVFFLHYNVTVSFLVLSSIFVTAGLYVGDPIECISDASVQDVIDSFCWVHSTFTIQSQWNNSTNSPEQLVAHPGVKTGDSSTTHLKYHGYYQWICYILGLQAMLFYIPRCIWKNFEGGRMKMLVNHSAEYLSLLNDAHQDQENVAANYSNIEKPKFLQYFLDNLGKQNFYYRKLVFCETLNLVLTLFQMYITNLTNLNYEDLKRLITLSLVDPRQRDDFMAQVFPRVTKCTFNVYGPSGNIQNHDSLCVLPFNTINEKIYIIMWTWLIFLAVLSILNLCYRALLLLPVFRMALLKYSTKYQEIESFNILREKLQIGDWFVVYQLGKNTNLLRFTEIIKRLQQQFHENH